MSKEKTREDKLREAAKYFKWDIYKALFGNLITFAKSSPVHEYHKSLQPKVNVEAVKQEFISKICKIDWVDKKPYVPVLTSPDQVFNWFLPHLQQPAQESDAVDFANYINKRMYTKYGDNWTDGKNVFSTEYIYNNEYKQPKTNSDEETKGQ